VAEVRFGLGFDVHAWGTSPPLMLGGVRFEEEPRLVGHSDADVVCHALGDALLGAAALGDLGDHFPEEDPEMSDLGGLELLRRVVTLINEAGLRPASCDVVVVAEHPSIGPHRQEIRANLAGVLGLPVDRVSVKATRPEGLGLTGEGAGCFALAAASTS
jgi:2-C-methyl-D-erythritol 2,4-cyclodiphosphate synthase